MPFSDQPRPGFYRMRRVKGGPFVAVSIGPRCPMVLPDQYIDPDEWCRPYDRSRPLIAWVDGVGDADPWKVYPRCHPVDQAEFLYLVDSRAWARIHTPQAPEANPTAPINIEKVAPIF